ncbi:MAG: arginine--tRNA ligase [Bacteroidia bacterium]|nr:MAG: arginine--tRNA ligase [Bacteroidia bacterium]
MLNIEELIAASVANIVKELSGNEVKPDSILIQKTRKEFEGDFTLVVFPFVRFLRQSPDQAADTIGKSLLQELDLVEKYQVVKGFLNLTLTKAFWQSFLLQSLDNEQFGYRNARSGIGAWPGEGIEAEEADDRPLVVEFSSPNTNKPLHLGHIRNNLLGYSVSLLQEAAGKKVVKVNLVNDRGIHICKSMLAWMMTGDGETPETSGKKGDKLVGEYYVRFEKMLREEADALAREKGLSDDEARNEAPLMKQARELLRKWEEHDPEVVSVWEKMNRWVYDGFDRTYARMGIDFDKIYYESDTYLLGRKIVLEGLKQGLLYRREDGSVWADLADHNMDAKLLLRADGTSVYMTQDIGTAQLRYDDYRPGKMIYVVGNEQNHHFSVLKKVLALLGKPYADAIHHLSYGMVELPAGRMKSREGTVVDADDLMDEMFATAGKMTEELGKTQDFSDEEKAALYQTIGLGALKYFILKVDPKKNMLFNPEESIDFNGNTGPFIQYTYARIRSVLRKAGEARFQAAKKGFAGAPVNEKEKQLLKALHDFPATVLEAAEEMSPARIANYAYELARAYNQFYHDHSVLNEPDEAVSNFRLCLSHLTAQTIHNAMALLGIHVPERM